MPDTLYQVEYTDRAINDSVSIKYYILHYFTQKEVNNFYSLLESFEKVVTVFPLLYPVSAKSKKIHRAVLSKQLSVFYTISNNVIIIISMFDNRMDYTKWP
ncbi:MAG: hypothetical protein JWR05_3021 [Mucilaginibacter sp.]|nr:hypothetical protein [Mucilaginibacter sp.]